MPVDENTIIVTADFSQKIRPSELQLVSGEYRRTDESIYCKIDGCTLSKLRGYWYIIDQEGNNVCWAAEGTEGLPKNGWVTRDEGLLGVFGACDDFPIRVEYKTKFIPTSGDEVAGLFKNSSNAVLGFVTQQRDTLSGMVQNSSSAISGMVQDSSKAGQDLWSQHREGVTATVKKSSNACYDFWTHPDTQDTMKKAAVTTKEGLMVCFAGCMAFIADMVEQVTKEEPKTADEIKTIENGEAVEKVEEEPMAEPASA